MKISLVCGSPKTGKSSSAKLLDYLAEKLCAAHEIVRCHVLGQDSSEIIASIAGSGAVVFSFPLFVDSVPSHVIRFLSERKAEFASSVARDAKIYALVNNGFYEAAQNEIAVMIMKRFTEKSGLAWGQGVMVGAGGLINSTAIGRPPLKKLGRALDLVANNISESKIGDDLHVEPSFPRFLYFHMANFSMLLEAGKNRAKKPAN
jgi:multimeric flavodoxin WrbA